jgi:hypothetical protein
MQGLKKTCSCVHHESKLGSACITAFILKVGNRKKWVFSFTNFSLYCWDIISFAPRIRGWMAPSASLNVVSIVTRLGAAISRHCDSITGSGKRFCSFPNHQDPSLSLSVYKSFCWNTLFFILFYFEVSRIVTYFGNFILAIPSPSLTKHDTYF